MLTLQHVHTVTSVSHSLDEELDFYELLNLDASRDEDVNLESQ
jgi:hypothetical protein